MAISVSPKASSAVAEAYKALTAEHALINEQIKSLFLKQKALQDVLESMKPLVESYQTRVRINPQAAWPFPLDVAKKQDVQTSLAVGGEDEEEDEDGDVDPGNLFAGMKFSQALWKHMIGKDALPTPIITKTFEQAGWKFRSDQWNHRVNQVGVTLRRFKGKLFEQNENGLWFAIDDL